MFNPTAPFSSFCGNGINGADLAFVEECEREDKIKNIINYFVDLLFDDYDINDAKVVNKVLAQYGLEDMTEAEMRRVEKEVERRIN